MAAALRPGGGYCWRRRIPLCSRWCAPASRDPSGELVYELKWGFRTLLAERGVDLGGRRLWRPAKPRAQPGSRRFTVLVGILV
jgi:hypothetical protein